MITLSLSVSGGNSHSSNVVAVTVGERVGVVATTTGTVGTLPFLLDKTTAGATDAAIMAAIPNAMPT